MGRKNPKLIVDGYDFKFEKKNGGSTFWSCPTQMRTKCKCRLITRGNVVYVRHTHNHEAKVVDISKMSYKEVMVKRCL